MNKTFAQTDWCIYTSVLFNTIIILVVVVFKLFLCATSRNDIATVKPVCDNQDISSQCKKQGHVICLQKQY